MSEPSYRIDTTFEVDPNFPNIPWSATIYRLSDDAVVGKVYGSTEEGAFGRARDTVKQLARGPQQGSTVYMDEEGEPCSETGTLGATCFACKGTGRAAPDISAACSVCNGSGIVAA